jgi:cytochrome c biogenesis protein CcmG/thiol:disulfide interchange protein DsbE
MTKRFAYIVPLAVLVVLAGYFLLGLQRDPGDLSSVLIDQKVPPFDLPPIDGRDQGFGRSDLDGQVALVNVFGSWCVACLTEHPLLMRLKETSAVAVYGIDWREPDREAGPAWLKRHGNPYTLIGDDPLSEGAIAFGVYGAPESFVVDAEGIIRYKHTGPITPKDWNEILEPLIERLRAEARSTAAK